MLMVIFIITVFFTMMIVEADYESQTIKISDSVHDGFVTETGIMWVDGSLVHISDPNMAIKAYLLFENIHINSYEVLNNATLRLRPGSGGETDPGSIVFLYGVKQSNLLGFFSASDVTGAIRTNAYTTLDTSVFPSGSWFEVDVTDIVSELINAPNWDGDDIGGISDNIGFLFSEITGNYDTRYFYDKDIGNGLEAQLVINWGDEPPTPTPPLGDPPLPPGDPDPEVNETYREFIIWEVDHNGPNRTGEGFTPEGITVNWNNLNLTLLTEIDSGNAITVNNATSASISAMEAQQINSLYNDTGNPANVTSFFARFGLKVSSVTNALAGADRVMGVVGISTSTPVGGGGLFDGGGGDWAGLLIYLNADDLRWWFRLAERRGVDFSFDPVGPIKTEGDGNTYWVEFVWHDAANISYIQYREYSDPLFQNRIHISSFNITKTEGPMRYPQLIASLDAGNSRLTGEFYTFTDFTLAENSTWMITYPNGTIIVQDLDDYEDAIDYIEDILGADPQDPDPPGQDWEQTGPFTRFKTRLYIFIMGLAMLLGPVMVFAYRRPSGYNFVIGLFIMLIGLSFLIHAGSV